MAQRVWQGPGEVRREGPAAVDEAEDKGVRACGACLGTGRSRAAGLKESVLASALTEVVACTVSSFKNLSTGGRSPVMVQNSLT
jgi:hypothetical protein